MLLVEGVGTSSLYNSVVQTVCYRVVPVACSCAGGCGLCHRAPEGGHEATGPLRVGMRLLGLSMQMHCSVVRPHGTTFALLAWKAS